ALLSTRTWLRLHQPAAPTAIRVHRALPLQPRRPAMYTLSPYTTLFRSRVHRARGGRGGTAGTGRRRGHRGGSGARGTQVLVHLRSEEHTSELQSHLNLVCRLLLEKKTRKRSRCQPPTCRRTTPRDSRRR